MRAHQEHVTHPDEALRWLQLAQPAFRGARHRHHALELTWIEHGSGMRLVGDSAEAFASGDLVLLGPQLPHTWLSTPALPSSAAQVPPLLQATVLQFPLTLLQQPALPELGAALPLAALAGRGLAIGGATHAAVTAVLRGLAAANRLQRLAGLIQILAWLLQGQADLRPLSSRAASRPGSSGQPERIDRVLDWVHAGLAQPLETRDAAALAHVSPAAFSRWFKREVGKTFTRYVNDVRCAEACLQLRTSALPVARVAANCGFHTLSHFNRHFAARQGCTPRQYRQQTLGHSV